MTHPARPNEVAHTFSNTAPGAAARPTPSSLDAERQELDHRLANSLQLAADFLIFEHMRVSDPQARSALIATADRLSAVGQMHRFLAGHRQSSGVDLDLFLTELGGLISDSTGLDCRVDAEPVRAPGEVAQQLAIVINELAMNAAKHAYAWGDRGALNVTCRSQGGKLVVIVADEGEGLDRRFTAGQTKGLGMSIVEAIVRQLSGTLDAVNDHGARFTITLPAPVAKPEGSRSFAPPEPPS